MNDASPSASPGEACSVHPPLPSPRRARAEDSSDGGGGGEEAMVSQPSVGRARDVVGHRSQKARGGNLARGGCVCVEAEIKLK
jgi:hypothetical protein